MNRRTQIALVVLSSAGLAFATRAQEPVEPVAPPEVEQQEPEQEPEHDHEHGPGIHEQEGVPLERAGGGNDAQREMIELFGKVERKLREIDELLVDAGSGNTRRLADASEAGIDELLNRSLSTGRSTIEDIDRILELASQMGAQQGQGQPQSDCPDCQSGSCNKPGHSGSPLDRGRQSTQREGTPKDPGGEKPGEREDGKQPQDGRPDSPLDTDDPTAENEAGDEPPPGETDAAARPAHAGDRWGDLPVHVQDIFRTEGDRHMPARYRDWIDAYYRKLSARAQRQ